MVEPPDCVGCQTVSRCVPQGGMKAILMDEVSLPVTELPNRQPRRSNPAPYE
ncbi:hypothetical protein ANCCAN_10853 [Ancylostoma caninum]|uniref:Uncharacterized protein n=1 Tax=Ancylostoma caninum TaxID=29170 RepID=A0A368GFL1_ANCCA|nr:hypothetical protein ANCCAN_10853 [Ancylostoma caninum]